MGLLDGLAGQVLGSVLGGQGEGGQGNQLVQIAMQLLQNQQGGLGGLLQQFQQAGLGSQVASWVGTGENQAIDGGQLQSALGADTISQIAAQLGIPADQASGALAGVLPQLVDKLTPDGQVTDQHNSLDGLAALAGQFLGGR